MANNAEQEIFILIAIGIAIMLGLAVAFVLFYYRAQRKMLLQKMDAQRQLLQATILAQEEERRRIAKDLHDEVGSKLNVIYLYVEQLKRLAKRPEKLEATMNDVTGIINTAIETTRRISHDLLPPVLEEFGFVEALKELCAAYNKLNLLDIQLQVTPEEGIVADKMVEVNLFRIVQELINNSIRHGKAKQVQLQIMATPTALQIFYKDDGKGFDATVSHKGLGMKSIESRLQIIQGTWTYESAPEQGLTVQISIASSLVHQPVSNYQL